MAVLSEIESFLSAHETAMFQLLEDLVKIQSGTHNKAGVDRTGALIQSVLADLAFGVEIHRKTGVGDHLVARMSGPDISGRQLLITGHMDTVFPKETTFTGYREDDRHCYGPGVIDMKGGLVVGIYALKALKACSLLNRFPIVFIFNSDEETGSRTSNKLIREEARKSKAAFVLEAGGLDGEIVTGRKGNLSSILKVSGRAGHAAFAGEDKASAIHELAHKIIAVEALNDPDKGITANVGLIAGGIGPNTVPEDACAKLDFRFLTPDDGLKIKKALEVIVSRTSVPGTDAVLEVVSGRPPMPQSRGNQDLFERLQSVADELGIPVLSELRQGCSDANLIADEGVPVIDGLGPIGAKDHSHDEYMVKSSLLQRTLLLANVIANFNMDSSQVL